MTKQFFVRFVKLSTRVNNIIVVLNCKKGAAQHKHMTPEAPVLYRKPTETHNREQRISLATREIEATKRYINNAIDTFTVHPGSKHLEFKKTNGLTTEQEVRDFLLKDKTGLHTNPALDIVLPFPYLESNDGYFGGQLYYWDSASHIKMLLSTDEPDPKRIAIAQGTIDNFEYLYDKLGFIPNASNLKVLNCSQPPLLTTMIRDTYNAMKQAKPDAPENKAWLAKKMAFAQREYHEVWTNPNDHRRTDKLLHHHTRADTLLQSYGDVDAGYHTNAERESGEDMTPRFAGRAHDFLAVDLNAKLALYEKHFEQYARSNNRQAEADEWKTRYAARVAEMNEKMWDEKTGFFYDYDYKNGCQGTIPSLAGFLPMWAGVATEAQAAKMVKKLPEFMQPYGLTVTTKDHPGNPERGEQWAYPNDFANRKQQVVEGLMRYGYVEEAITIMERTITAYAQFFDRHKTLPEKINAVTGEYGDGAKYPKQQGFGWTNATFLEFTRLLPLAYELRDKKTNN